MNNSRRGKHRTTSNCLTIKVASSGDKLEVDSRASGGTDGDVDITGDVADGEWHHVKVAIDDGRLAVQLDGLTRGQDTNVTRPTGLNSCKRGRSISDANYLNGRLRNVRFYRGWQL